MFRFIYTILANLFRAPYIVPRMRKMAKNPDKYSEKMRYLCAQKMIIYMMNSGRIKADIYGKENLPKEGGYMMFPNHQGKYDALAIIHGHDEPCSFVMDKAKSYTFMVRELVNLLQAKRIEIDNVRQAFTIINELTEDVKQGKKYILFSEGGYTNNHNNVQQFKPGSFKSAVRAKAPVVPVALIDTYIPFNSTSIKPVTCQVHFLEPIYYEEYKDLKTPQLAEMVKERIVECIKANTDNFS